MWAIGTQREYMGGLLELPLLPLYPFIFIVSIKYGMLTDRTIAQMTLELSWLLDSELGVHWQG